MSATEQVVFFHRNWSWYLPYVLHQARAACPGAEVVLVGEVPVRGFPLVPLGRFERGERAQDFRRRYRHMSPNPEAYELFCFLRWFYLLDHMEAQGLERALHLDSDVLLFASLDELERTHPLPPGGAGFSIPHQDHDSLGVHASAHAGLFTRDALRRFCDFVTVSFTEERWLERYRRTWAGLQGRGGVSDMSSLYHFWREHPQAVVNLSEERGGAAFDHNVNLSSNHRRDEYQLRGGIKRLEVHDGQPAFIRADGHPVRALGVHFQGKGKLQIPRFYRGPAFPGQALGDAHAGFKRLQQRLKQWVRSGWRGRAGGAARPPAAVP